MEAEGLSLRSFFDSRSSDVYDKLLYLLESRMGKQETKVIYFFSSTKKKETPPAPSVLFNFGKKEQKEKGKRARKVIWNCSVHHLQELNEMKQDQQCTPPFHPTFPSHTLPHLSI